MPRRNSTPPMKVTPKVKVRKTRTCKDCLQVERVDSDDPSLMLGPLVDPIIDEDDDEDDPRKAGE